MTPFYFGTAERRLFGAYSPARSGRSSRRGVVLCNAWGQEYLRSHRSLNLLASRLSEASLHVLRFDYFGTGDSAGEMIDASLSSWEDDISTAVDELQDTADLQRVRLVGLRMGGVLAARVAAKRAADIESLVLWDPIVSGQDYMSELMQSSRFLDFPQEKPTERDKDAGGGFEILGFPLSAAMAAEFSMVDLATSLTKVRAPTLVVASHHDGAMADLGGLVQGDRPGTRAVEVIASQPCWVQEGGLGAGAIPVDLVKRIVDWHA